MASLGISEFTFGFGFLSEQTKLHWANLRVAPILPSLQREQKEGWDAHLPLKATDYYYQFKLSDYMERSNSKFIADGTYNSPYYKIALHKKNQNQQHDRLKFHSLQNEHVYYVAPEFHSIYAFNSAYLNQQILNNSRLIPLRHCRHINDSEQHYITYQPKSPIWRLHSEAETHADSVMGSDLSRLYKSKGGKNRVVNKEFATELFEKTADTTRKAIELEKSKLKKKKKSEFNEPVIDDSEFELLNLNTTRNGKSEILRQTSQILSVFFGLTLVLVGESNE